MPQLKHAPFLSPLPFQFLFLSEPFPRLWSIAGLTSDLCGWFWWCFCWLAALRCISQL